MGFPTVPGFPAYESGSASQFTPAIWSGKLREKHYSTEGNLDGNTSFGQADIFLVKYDSSGMKK